MTQYTLAWQPFSTAPKTGEPILVAAPGVEPRIVRWKYIGPRAKWRWEAPYGAMLGTPTHWMPVPPSPGADE